eukprot:scaffold93869_cov58-Phaeocystis_antarctica.AAC.2
MPARVGSARAVHRGVLGIHRINGTHAVWKALRIGHIAPAQAQRGVVALGVDDHTRRHSRAGCAQENQPHPRGRQQAATPRIGDRRSWTSGLEHQVQQLGVSDAVTRQPTQLSLLRPTGAHLTAFVQIAFPPFAIAYSAQGWGGRVGMAGRGRRGLGRARKGAQARQKRGLAGGRARTINEGVLEGAKPSALCKLGLKQSEQSM